MLVVHDGGMADTVELTGTVDLATRTRHEVADRMSMKLLRL
ncbi:hypothetical protein ACGH2B_01980 [Streptomyces sp. BBFR2]